jgi:hypothetical protein
MHGYIVKNKNCQKASNGAGWRPKMGEKAGGKIGLSSRDPT